jgi:paraquat-inducible protein A
LKKKDTKKYNDNYFMKKNIIAVKNKQICAMEAGFSLCYVCNKVFSTSKLDGDKNFCTRCGAKIYIRKPNSIIKTWALLITATILTFPANILPIMRVNTLGVADDSTIISGIIFFLEEGSYGIGVIIFTASILVPFFKITGICLILISIHFKLKVSRKHKALMFRFIKFIGRWSMLDIFVITILQGFINFGFLTSIDPAPGAIYFTGVVLTTMCAAIVFDPRLIWDI